MMAITPAVPQEFDEYKNEYLSFLKEIEQNIPNNLITWRSEKEAILVTMSDSQERLELLKLMVIFDAEREDFESLKNHLSIARQSKTVAAQAESVTYFNLFDTFLKIINHRINGNDMAINELVSINEQDNSTNNKKAMHALNASLYGRNGDYFNALKHVNEALKLEGVGQSGAGIDLYSLWYLGFLNSIFWDLENSIDVYRQSFRFSILNGLPFSINNILYNESRNLADINQKQLAITYFKFYKKFAVQLQLDNDIKWADYGLALLYTKMKRFQESHDLLVKLDDFSELGPRHISMMQQSEALNLASLGRTEEARNKIAAVETFFIDYPLLNTPELTWILHRAKIELLFSEGEIEEASSLIDNSIEQLIVSMFKKTSLDMLNLVKDADAQKRDLDYQILINESSLEQRDLMLKASVVVIGIMVISLVILLFLVNRLNITKKRLEQKNRFKSDFLANMSHDLRTPLNAIIGFSETIKLELFGPVENKKYLEYNRDIHDTGKYLLQLVNDILDLTSLEINKRELDCETIDISGLLLECHNIVHKLAEDKNIKLTMNFLEDAPALYADKKALKQILLNLLSNAIKFIPNNENIIIRTDVCSENYIIQVIDTGNGISDKDIKLIIEPFTKAEVSPLLSHGEGTGLGLAIVKSLIDLHGGKLMINSKIGKGTTVTISLPL